MSRDAQGQAKKTYKSAQDVYNTNSSRSTDLYDRLNPIYSSEAYNPQGYSPTDLASMETAVRQNAGGAVAGAVSEGNLEAARTGNAGGFATALDDSVRDAMKGENAGSLAIQQSNADLKEKKRQAGIEGLSGLYGTTDKDVLASLGVQNQSTQALTEAGKSGWFQNMMGMINAFRPSGGFGGGSPSYIGFGG
jgi:hypothetical protein